MAFLRVLQGKRIVNGSSVLFYLVVYFFSMDKRNSMGNIIASPSKAHCKGSKQIIKEECTLKITVSLEGLCIF